MDGVPCYNSLASHPGMLKMVRAFCTSKTYNLARSRVNDYGVAEDDVAEVDAIVYKIFASAAKTGV